jgi:hypothetical protein
MTKKRKSLTQIRKEAKRNNVTNVRDVDQELKDNNTDSLDQNDANLEELESNSPSPRADIFEANDYSFTSTDSLDQNDANLEELESNSPSPRADIFEANDYSFTNTDSLDQNDANLEELESNLPNTVPEYESRDDNDNDLEASGSKHGDDSSDDDGAGENTYDDCDNVMDNVELAMLTDTASIDVDKDLVIRLLAVLIPLKIFLSTRLGGGYSETKQSNCALRLSNMLVWTALNSSQKKILDEATLLPWMEEILRSEYTSIDSYCQYLEETKFFSASTIRNYLYDFG